MITWIVNFVFCSGFFWAIYRLLLASEHMYRFNRFYLLFSLFFSLMVPLICINARTTVLPASYPIAIENAISPDVTAQPLHRQIGEGLPTSYLPLLLCLIYVLISLVLLARFAINLWRISKAAISNTGLDYQQTRLILLEEEITPHSFLKYIFINKKDYREGRVEPEIIYHERTHVKQLHSIDILFAEFLQALCWFNPFIAMYKHDIKLNHEFLADEAVANHFPDKTVYQYLLLAKASEGKSLILTSQFSYLTTKKRLIMMTKHTSPKMAFVKKLSLAPLLALSVFLFSQRVAAERPQPASQTDSLPAKQAAQRGIIEEYKSILAKYGTITGRKGFRYQATNFTTADKAKLVALYRQMSPGQQQKQSVQFLPAGPPMAKISPTEKQLDAWKDAGEYGVWVDGKKIKNPDLENYTAISFDHYFVSRLTKAALHHNEYHYQVDLMTATYYAQYYKTAKAKEGEYMAATAIFPPPVR